MFHHVPSESSNKGNDVQRLLSSEFGHMLQRDLKVRRELRLKEQEVWSCAEKLSRLPRGCLCILCHAIQEMRQNIARRQGQETGKPHNYTGPGRIDET